MLKSTDIRVQILAQLLLAAASQREFDFDRMGGPNIRREYRNQE
jgi:hypothetical protein